MQEITHESPGVLWNIQQRMPGYQLFFKEEAPNVYVFNVWTPNEIKALKVNFDLQTEWMKNEFHLTYSDARKVVNEAVILTLESMAKGKLDEVAD